jgi:hypothetical protein
MYRPRIEPLLNTTQINNRSGMPNINNLVTQWGTARYDYVILHFDDSAGEWFK